MPKATLKDVAAVAGVSYQTVSKVLNGQAQVAAETEKRIWRAVEELNYRPNIAARNLRTQASNLLGFAWCPPPNSIWHPILNRFLYSVMDAATAQGYLITVFPGNDQDIYADTNPYVDLYARRQVEGFILADVLGDDPGITYLIDHHIPFTAFGRSNERREYSWVDVDGCDGIQKVMAHLTERGHERIAFITWRGGWQTGRHREEGYRNGLRAAGLSFNPAWVIRGDDSAQTSAEAMHRFITLPYEQRPSAIVCVSDLIALGVMQAAIAAGLQIGQDIAITGYDNLPITELLHPPLTTVSQPIWQVGQQVVELLLKQLQGESIGQKGVLLKPELIIRASS